MAVRLISVFFCLVYFGAIVFAQQPDLELFLEQSEEYSDLSDLMEIGYFLTSDASTVFEKLDF